jgi:hypothetical protein
VWIGSCISRRRKQARARRSSDLEGEASSGEIELCVLVLFLCCCVAEGIVAWGVCVYILGVDLELDCRRQRSSCYWREIALLCSLVS